jgi:hypothetical protein
MASSASTLGYLCNLSGYDPAGGKGQLAESCCYSVGTGKHVKSEQQDCSAGVYEWGACRYYNSRRNTDRWTDRVDTIGHR